MDDMDTTPTIRPVLDMTDIMTGMSEINGLFGANRTFQGTFTGSTFMREASGLNYSDGKIAGPMNNKDVVLEIRRMNEKFDGLSQAVGNMKVVLDSGALVGETIKQTDQQLGVLAGRRGRGN